jgi:serine/threonine protein phosphatase PrpC
MKLNLPKETTMERIFSFYVTGTDITAKEEEIRMRWEMAYSLILQYGNTQTVIPMLEKQFEIKKAQAYRDINNALNLFGDVNKSNKQAKRNLIYQLAMKIYEMAEQQKDTDQMTKALTLAAKVEGLDKDDPEIPDFNNFQQHIYNIVCDPELLGMKPIQNLEAEIEKFKQKKLKTIHIDGDNS